MARRSRSLAPDPLASFPPWARMLAERYYTKTISTFILHGAVRDLQPADDGKGGKRFLSLRNFLSDELFGTRDLVLFYDRSSGVRSATRDMPAVICASASVLTSEISDRFFPEAAIFHSTYSNRSFSDGSGSSMLAA